MSCLRRIARDSLSRSFDIGCSSMLRFNFFSFNQRPGDAFAGFFSELNERSGAPDSLWLGSFTWAEEPPPPPILVVLTPPAPPAQHHSDHEPGADSGQVSDDGFIINADAPVAADPGNEATQATPLTPKAEVSIAAVSNDPGYSNGSLWGMLGDTGTITNAYGSQANEAWAAGHTGSMKTVVGVIDTGIDYTHPDLYLNIWLNQREIPTTVRASLSDIDSDGLITFRDLNGTANASYVLDYNSNGRIDAGDLLNDARWENGGDEDGNGYRDDLIGWDFVNNDNDPFDDNSHGTHVSGTIGGIGGNGIGVAGVNWNVQMVALKFLSASGSGSVSGAIGSVDYFTGAATRASAGENFVATNNSWGGGGYSQALNDAIGRAAQQDILFVAAAGNSTSNNDVTANYPSNYSTTSAAGYDAVVAVASLTNTGALSSFSSYGATNVDLAAPGSSIYSTLPGGGYGTYSGTSMATPHVTGAVALYAAANPNASAAEIKQALLASSAATASLTGKVLTGGRLDIGTLMNSTPQPPPPPPGSGDVIAGDASTTASLTASAAQASVVDTAGDQDWFRLNLTAGYRYDFALNAAAGSSLNSYLRILDANGGVISANDDAVGLNSRISFTANSSATYFISAEGSGASTGSYTLAMTQAAPVDAIAGSAATTATLTPTAPQASVVDTEGDQDWFRLNLIAGYRYDFTMDATAGSTLDTYLRLLNSGGAELAFNDDAVGLNSRLAFTATTSGTYYLSAQGYGTTTGGYSLGMTQTAPVDIIAGNTSTTATISPGVAQNSSIDLVGDQDWFRINLTAGSRYDFALNAATGSSLNTTMRLLDANGVQLAFNDDAVGLNSRISFTATTSATYYVSAQGTGSSIGGYALSVAQTVLADNIAGSTATNATLSTTTPRSSAIDLAGDQDWFRLSLTAGYRYDFAMDATAGSTLDTYLRLLNSSGAELAFNDDAAGLNSRLSFVATTGGTFYLSAQGYGTTTGGYSLAMTQTLADMIRTGTAANDLLNGAGGNDSLSGLGGNDILSGFAGADRLDGGIGHDQLNGGAGNDILIGGTGRDELTGGADADIFRFLALSDSAVGGNRDLITDFRRAQGDRIDLSGIDANGNLAGDQAFAFIGTAAFSRVAGQARFSRGLLQVDVNGDGRSDMDVAAQGLTALLATDFYL